MRAKWPLVGRSAELGVALEAMERGGLVLAGPAGVGKSRMTEEMAAALAEQRKVRTCTVTRSVGSVPLGALVPLLEHPSNDTNGDLAVRFARIGEELADALSGSALLIDDAHLLDDASAAVVHRLAHESDIALLVVCRTPDPAPPALDDLWRDGLLERLDLQPLSDREVRELVEIACGGPVSLATGERLLSVSAGNPLLLRELVVDARASGSLQRQDGLWTWTGEVTASPRLSTVVARCSDRLGPESRQVLRLLAVAEPLPVSLLERVAGAPSLLAAEAEDLIAIDEGTVWLRHPLFGEVTRDAMGVTGRHDAIRALLRGAAGEASHNEELDARLAVLGLDVGEAVNTTAMARASQRATQMGDPETGERLAAIALANRADDFAASLARCDALVALGRIDEAVDLLASLAGNEPDPDSVVYLAHRRALLTSVLSAATVEAAEAAEAIVADAEARVGDEDHRLFLQAVRAEVRLNRGDLAGAEAMGQSVLSAPNASAPARLLGAHMASLAATLGGAPARGAITAGDHFSLALAEAAAAPSARGWMLLDRWLGLTYDADLDAASDLCCRLLDGTEPLAPAFDGSAALFQGRIHLLIGQPVSAEGWLRQSVTSLRRHDPRGYLPWALGLLASALALRGDVTSADAVAEESRSVESISAGRLFDGDRYLALAWVASARGEQSAAAEFALALGFAAIDRGVPAFAAIALYDAWRLGSTDAIEPLVDTLTQTEGGLARLQRNHAVAAKSADPEALKAAGDALAAAGVLASGAEALLAAAELFAADGRRDAARTCGARATALLERCEGIRTPRIANRVIAPSRLTRRESEVAELAARGSSNREIASILGTSVRTVEGHLLRASTKLGVGSRHNLAEALALDLPTNS